MVVDADHRLQFRDIEILRSTSDEVLVRGGLSEGELVCISTLDVVTDGMAVRVVDDDTRMGNTTTNSATATTPLTPAVALTSVVPVAVTRPSPDTVVPTPVASGLEFEPALNREEQIAAIRRLMLGDPVLTGAPSAPTARVDKPAVSDEAAPSVAGSTKRVAVLPFANLSRNPADDWIGNGFTDALRSTLKVAAAMEVVALTAGDEATVLETAAARNVRWLVEGGYQRIGDKLRLTARVLEVSDGDLVDSIKLDSTLDDLDALTSSLVAAVRAGLGNVAVASPITAEPPPGRSGRLEDRVVAILPFTNISRDGEDDRIGTDLTEALARGLLRIDGVSILALEETDKADTIQADAARGVVRLITGGYQRVGNRVRITARLLDVASGTLIQTAKVDGTIEDLPGLLTEMVSTLRAALEERSARRVREWILFPIAGETA
jgi:TolB-like protein